MAEFFYVRKLSRAFEKRNYVGPSTDQVGLDRSSVLINGYTSLEDAKQYCLALQEVNQGGLFRVFNESGEVVFDGKFLPVETHAEGNKLMLDDFETKDGSGENTFGKTK